jgi:anti-anti-sigma regulatory factor
MATGIIEQPVGEIRPGDHAAFSFTTAEEQQQVIGPFVHDGLDAQQKVIYISGVHPRQLPGMHARTDADHLTRTGQLRLLHRDTTCLTRGHFDPDRMLTVIGEEIALATEQGYSAMRVTGDMSWVLDEPGGYPLMLECEARFDEAITPEVPLMAICQLNRNRCPPDQLSALNATHRLRVTANPEFDDGVLRITRTHTPNGLRLIGELDAARHPAFLTALTSVNATHPHIHLDFAQVRFLDLATLSLLITHTGPVRPGHTLILDNLPPDVVNLIQTLGWHRFPSISHGQPKRSEFPNT